MVVGQVIVQKGAGSVQEQRRRGWGSQTSLGTGNATKMSGPHTILPQQHSSSSVPAARFTKPVESARGLLGSAWDARARPAYTTTPKPLKDTKRDTLILTPRTPVP